MMSRPNSILAIEIRVDHEPIVNHEFENELEAYQAFVGGLIEAVHLPRELLDDLEEKFGVTLHSRTVLVCNDDFVGLPLNPIASLISTLAGAGPICGDCLLVNLP